MRGPTRIFWANITPFSLEAAAARVGELERLHAEAEVARGAAERRVAELEGKIHRVDPKFAS